METTSKTGSPGSQAPPICDEDGVHPERAARVREAMPDVREVREASEILKAIAYPVRMNILSALHLGELCVCDLQEVLDMSQSAVSHQLRTLRAAHLVDYRREGKQVYYSLSDEHVHEILEMTLQHVRHD